MDRTPSIENLLGLLKTPKPSTASNTSNKRARWHANAGCDALASHARAWAKAMARKALQNEALRQAAEDQQARLTAQKEEFRRARKRKRAVVET